MLHDGRLLSRENPDERLEALAGGGQAASDIADGSFDESLFAADLGMVDRGRGPADYLDPVTFCEKTYLTENLQAFLR